MSRLYVLIVSMLLIYHGWRRALLSIFLIVLSQFFRYIANDVDRIGWNITNRQQGKEISESTKTYQSLMLYLLVGLTQLLNLMLIYQAYHLGGAKWLSGTFVSLMIIEVLYFQIRRVNRRVEFEQASYGFRDKGVFSDGSESISPSERSKEDKTKKKLDKLKQMAEEGEISQKAYKRTRDKFLIDGVMDPNRMDGVDD